MIAILPPLAIGDKWIGFASALKAFDYPSMNDDDGYSIFYDMPEQMKCENEWLACINKQGFDWLADYAGKCLKFRDAIEALLWSASIPRIQAVLFDQPDPGFIYVVSDGDGAYKIGRATDVNRRLGGLSTGSPGRLTLIHSFFATDHAEREKQMHDYFADRRIRGEWYALTDADVEYIKSLQHES